MEFDMLSSRKRAMRLTNMVTAIDLHAAGEPGRLIIGGVIDVPGKSMFEKMWYLRRNA
jgi:proline racemase